MPIEGGLNGGAAQGPDVTATPPAAPAAPAPISMPSAATTPPPSGVSVPSQPVSTLGSAVPAAAAGPAPAFSLREFVNTQIPGVQQRYQSDADLARELLQTAMRVQQMEPYAQIGQRFSPHVTEFEQWQRERAAAQQTAAAQQQKSWWQPPEYDPAWEKMVIRDPNTGNLVVMPGNPLDIPSKIQKYQDFQRNMLHNLTKDPVGTLKEGIVNLIREEAGRINNEQMSNYQANQFASGYVEKQIGWLAQKDAAGNPIRLQNGDYALTPAGERFRAHVAMLGQQGVVDPRTQAHLAERLVMADLAAMQVQGAQSAPAASQQQAGPAFGAAPNNPNYGANAGAVAKPGQTLKDQLWEGFENAGLASRPRNVI